MPSGVRNASTGSCDWSRYREWVLTYFGSMIEMIRQTLNYNEGLYRWLRAYCPPPVTVLEAGSGIGLTAMTMQGMGYTVTAIDNEEEAILELRRLAAILCPGVKAEKRDIYTLRPETGQYDLVTSLGVIEHFDHDSALRMMQKLMQMSRKFVLVTVPISENEEEARFVPIRVVYNERTLKNLMVAAGLRIIDTYKWGQSLAILGVSPIFTGYRKPWFVKARPLARRLLTLARLSC